MSGVKEYINNLSLKRKIVVYAYLVTGPILIIICSLLIMQRYYNKKADIQEQGIHNVEALSDSLELIMTDVREFSNYIMINDEVMAIVKSEEADQLNQDPRLWQNHTSIGMVEDMMELKGYIKTIAIYPENGVRPYFRSIDTTTYIQTLEAVRDTAFYKKAIEKRGKTSWAFVSRAETEVYVGSRTDKIVLYRELFDLTKTKPLAYLVLGISADTVTAFCDNMLFDGNEGILILNNDGQMMVSRGKMEAEIVEHIESVVRGADLGGQKTKIIEYLNQVVFLYQKDSLSPIVCKVIDEPSVAAIAGEVVYMPVLLLLGVLAGLLPVLLFVSDIVTKPLHEVRLAMIKFREGDFEQQVAVKTGDEIGEVAAGFNEMVKSLKDMINKNYVMALKEKESELITLQAQINPHFLYNTLDTIYWKASEQGNEEIADDIYTLSQLFRLVLGQGKGSVPVRTEMELVQRYLEIQKMRFGDKLKFDITVDPAIEDIMIPKLVLQPFVENAAVHGMGNSENSCSIFITGMKQENRMRFTVRDTGIGMAPEQIQEIWSDKEVMGSSSYKIGGYAIYNVKERLELKYQDNFLLEITSVQNEGTTVVIELPLESQ